MVVVFYDSIDFIDFDTKIEKIDRKVILDAFTDEAPAGYELADSYIRDCIEIWARPFLFMRDKDCNTPKYYVVTDSPEAYRDRGMDLNLISVNEKK